MKLNKTLTIDGQQCPLIEDDVRLDLRAPGRAVFTVVGKQPLRGLVTLDIGYNN